MANKKDTHKKSIALVQLMYYYIALLPTHLCSLQNSKN